MLKVWPVIFHGLFCVKEVMVSSDQMQHNKNLIFT